MRPLLDLLFAATCVGCDAAGHMWCAACAVDLARPARLCMPTPSPPGMPATFAVADYAGPVRAAVLAYKERDAVALRRPLASALAAAVVAATGRGAVAVVPVPSTRAARRRRGFDPMAGLARTAVGVLRTQGRSAAVVPVLTHVRAVGDSAGLSSVQRAANLAGAFGVRGARPRHTGVARIVLVDDIVTTGATLADAARALRAAGLEVAAAATVAATVRQDKVVRAGLHKRRADDYGAGRGLTPTEEAPAWTSS